MTTSNASAPPSAVAPSTSATKVVALPKELTTWVQSALRCKVELRLSPVALALTLTPMWPHGRGADGPTGRQADDGHWIGSVHINLRSLAQSLVHISGFAATAWPLQIVVDLSRPAPAGQNEAAQQLRAELLRMANDPTWHRGDWALYVWPMVPVAGGGVGHADSDGERVALGREEHPAVDWFGAKTAAELVDDLLGPSVVDPAKLPNVHQVSRQEVAKALGDQGAHGDLRQVFIAALNTADAGRRLQEVRNLGEDRLQPTLRGEG
jgi:hypothetical protein